ncbi:hypothetical protein EW146_g5570 [Bondarzewia mesenterica]|uniref:Uncharacterized protein n=1 Tax=Bondarzewia mesenterica TaxID=1095465 RepID=A0A4S4LT62_9AGAM|nr:hypothetical protein EW146_g5570 [Bondarzewia mesenterica]
MRLVCTISHLPKSPDHRILQGIRFVAVNRRNFPGSTPFTSDEASILATGDDRQKSASTTSIPPISDDGKIGGIALLGWSVRAPFACATIASVDSHAHSPCLWTPDSREKLGARYRCQHPAELRLRAFAHWMTAYFDHGDLFKRDLDLLSYIMPSTSRSPTIFTMAATEVKDIPQLKESYRNAFFDSATAELFRKMEISILAGDRSLSWGLAGLWAVQDDAKELGNG